MWGSCAYWLSKIVIPDETNSGKMSIEKKGWRTFSWHKNEENLTKVEKLEENTLQSVHWEGNYYNFEKSQ